MGDDDAAAQMKKLVVGTWSCFGGECIISIFMDGTYSNESVQAGMIIRGTWEFCGCLGIRNVIKMRRSFTSVTREDGVSLSFTHIGLDSIIDDEGYTYSLAEIRTDPLQKIDSLYESDPECSATRGWSERNECNKLGYRIANKCQYVPRAIDLVPEVLEDVGMLKDDVEEMAHQNVDGESKDMILHICFVNGNGLDVKVGRSDLIGVVRSKIHQSLPKLRGRLHLTIGETVLDDEQAVIALPSTRIHALLDHAWVLSEDYFEHDPCFMVPGAELEEAEDAAELHSCVAFARHRDSGDTYLINLRFNKIATAKSYRDGWDWYDRNI